MSKLFKHFWAWAVVGALVPLLLLRWLSSASVADWTSTLFYTLSTIAQSIAAAIGVLAAFSFFRSTHGGNRLGTMGEALMREMPHPNDEGQRRSALASQEWDEFLERAEASRAYSPLFSGVLDRMNAENKRINDVWREFREAVPLAFHCLIPSILLLPAVPFMAKIPVVAACVACAVAALSLRALISLQRLIPRTLGKDVFVSVHEPLSVSISG